MNITFVTNQDFGGLFANYSAAIEQYTVHHSRCLVGFDCYGYTSDLVMKRVKNARQEDISSRKKQKEITTTLDSTDILIYDIGYNWDETFHNLKWDWNNRIKNKFGFVWDVNQSLTTNQDPVITNQPSIYFGLKSCSNARVEFIPSIIDTVNDLFKNKIKDTQNIILSHSTRNRQNKNTESVIKLASYLANDCDVDIDIIENCGYKDCIARKKKSHIGIDHIHQDYRYYGLSSLENSILGLINFVALQDKDIELIKKFFGMDFVPWHIVKNEGEAYVEIKKLCNDIPKLQSERLITMSWFNQFWDNSIVASKLIKIMEDYYGLQ